MKKISWLITLSIPCLVGAQDYDSNDPAPLTPPITAPAPTAPAAPAPKTESKPAEAIPDLTPYKVPESSNVESFGAGEGGTLGDGDDSYKVGALPDGEREEGAPREDLPQVYSIEAGDTLWDICGKMLDNPWYWPKLWSLNEYITNPHIISPGKQLRFFGGSATSFPKIDVIDPNAPAPTSATTTANAGITTQEKIHSIAQTGGSSDVEVKLNMVSVLSEKEIQPLGKIGNSVAPKMELTFGDYIYLNFNKKMQVSVGDRFHVIHRVGSVKDPHSTFGDLGVMIRKAAVVQVTKLTKNVVEARIIDNYESVNRGDEIVTYTPQIRTIPQGVEASPNLKGQIVASEHRLTMVGSQDFVYLDIGKKQGVQDGQRLSVVKQGDGLPVLYGTSDDLPDVVIGRLMVVDTYENTSMAYILSIDEELQIGSRVRGSID